MWYGFRKTPNLSRMAKNRANRLNLKDRKFGSPLPRRNSHSRTSFSFRIPLNWRLVTLSKRTLSPSPSVYYLYDKAYYVNFLVFGQYIPTRYDNQTHSLNFKLPATAYNYKAYLKTLSSTLSRFSRPFFLKVRFKGKGYYMYKTKRNTIAPQMGYAHRVYVYSNNITVKFLSKTKIILFGWSKPDVFRVGYALSAVRPINIFTGRGVRFARQIIYRKTGKVSSYR